MQPLLFKDLMQQCLIRQMHWSCSHCLSCRFQSDHLQEPVPGQHMCSLPALGMLLELCHGHRDSCPWGADCCGSRAGQAVRCVHSWMPETVPRVLCLFSASVHPKAESEMALCDQLRGGKPHPLVWRGRGGGAWWALFGRKGRGSWSPGSAIPASLPGFFRQPALRVLFGIPPTFLSLFNFIVSAPDVSLSSWYWPLLYLLPWCQLEVCWGFLNDVGVSCELSVGNFILERNGILFLPYANLFYASFLCISWISSSHWFTQVGEGLKILHFLVLLASKYLVRAEPLGSNSEE